MQNSRHFRDDQAPKVTNICRGARVQITGRNFEPDWGLYNGAIGTVKEIVYSADESPIEGHFPQYVIVQFPQYCGPPWMPEQPTVSLTVNNVALYHTATNNLYFFFMRLYSVGAHTNYQAGM